jgi:hypothetical protein
VISIDQMLITVQAGRHVSKGRFEVPSLHCEVTEDPNCILRPDYLIPVSLNGSPHLSGMPKRPATEVNDSIMK